MKRRPAPKSLMDLRSDWPEEYAVWSLLRTLPVKLAFANRIGESLEVPAIRVRDRMNRLIKFGLAETVKVDVPTFEDGRWSHNKYNHFRALVPEGFEETP